MAIDRRVFLSSLGAGAAAAAAGRTAAGDTTASGTATSAGRHIDLAVQFITERNGGSTVRGRERASYEFNDDGTITFRATSISDSPRVTRDVVYTLDSRFHPLEAFVRLQVDGRHEGSGWFRFEDRIATAETWNATHGRRSQSLELGQRARAFLAHPVSTDALVCAAFDRTASARRQRPSFLDSSKDPYGRTGPELSAREADIEFVGETPLTTPRGRFVADHYRLYLAPTDREPLEERWCLAGTFVLLQARAAGAYQTRYELTDWNDSAA
jgi:hypothetical protein